MLMDFGYFVFSDNTTKVQIIFEITKFYLIMKMLSLKKTNKFVFCSLNRIFFVPLHYENRSKKKSNLIRTFERNVS